MFKKKKNGSILYKFEINKRGRVLINSRVSGKNRKINKRPIRLLDAYEHSSLFKTEMNNHK